MYTERPSWSLPGAVLWTARQEAEGGVVLPDGCMDLIWLDGQILATGADTQVHSGAPARVGSTAAGVRLPPGLAPVLLGVPAAELRDQRVPLADLWGERRARVWHEHLAASDGRPEHLEQLIEQALAGRARTPQVTAAAAWAARQVPVAQIADRLGVTTRTLHRWSLDAFGYGTRTLSRVLRLHRALDLLGQGHPPAEVAQRAGYADQPHLSREVRELTGQSPAAFVVRREAA